MTLVVRVFDESLCARSEEQDRVIAYCDSGQNIRWMGIQQNVEPILNHSNCHVGCRCAGCDIRQTLNCTGRMLAWRTTRTKPVECVLAPVRPPATHLTAIPQIDSSRQRRMRFQIAAGDLRSTRRPDLTELPEQSPIPSA